MNRFILFASLLACCGFPRLNAQCNLTVDAGPDLKVCNVGDMIMINGKVTGNIQEIFWEPSTGLSNPRSPVTKATVSGNQEYILTARGLSTQNLIINGNFEAGRTGFYTDYILGFMSCYGAGYLDCEGTYDVINNPQNGHTGFAPCGDHTSGSGLMMVLNGAAAFQNVWCQTVPVMPDMDYVFTAWVTSVVAASPPILQFSINGNPIGPNFTSSGAVCTWEKYEVIWNSGSNTSAQICILNENTATGGNDFAIDDIGFRKICEVKDTMMIEVEEFVIDIEEPEFMTCDNPMIKLHAKGSSGGPGWTYRWTTSDGKIISGGNTTEPTIKGPGTYYFTICSPLPNCCQTQSIEVMGNITPPELFMTVKDTLGCNKLSVTINTRSNRFPLDYEWSGPNGFNAQDPLVVVTEAGTYVLTITDEYNCKTIDSVTVFERIDNPKISIRSNQINCKEDTAKLIGRSSVAGSVFEWTGPNNQFKKDSLWEVVDSGLYILKVISPSGCIKWDSVRIGKDDLSPQLQYASDTIRCSLDSASIRVSSNRRIIRSDWQSMHGFLQIDSLHIRTHVPGSYQLLVEADNGCLDSLTIQVVADTLHPMLNPSADTLNCLSDSVALISQSSDPNAMIFWTGPNGFQSFKDSTFTKLPGSYTAVALSSNGCSDTMMLLVAADTIRPQLSGGTDTLTCTKTSVQLDLTDPFPSQYDWAGPNGFNSRLKNPVTAIPGNYSVTASLPNGCTASLTLVIAIDTIRPRLSVQDDTLTCRFDSIQLQAAIQPASANAMWTGPNNFQSDEQHPYIEVPGIYHLRVTGDNGCTDSASLQIFQDIRKPELSIQTDTLNCVKRTATLRVASTIQPVQFDWSGPGGFSDTSETITVNRSGTFIITATTPELCITSQSVEVWEDTIRPDLQLFADSLNCLVREITLRTLSNADLRQFEWSGSGNFNSMLREPLIQNGGTYQLKVTSANQCTAIQSIQVHQDTIAPGLSLIADSIRCDHRTASLMALVQPVGLVGEWTLPDQSKIRSNAIQTNSGGWFMFDVAGDNYCIASQQLFVAVDTVVPDLSTVSDSINCYHPVANLLSNSNTSGIQYRWNGPGNFTSSNPNIQTQIPGLYRIQVFAPNGCQNQQTLNIPIDTVHPVVLTQADSIDCKHPDARVTASSPILFGQFTWRDEQNRIVSPQSEFRTSRGGRFTVRVQNMVNGCEQEAVQIVQEDSLLIRDVNLFLKNPICGAAFGTAEILKVAGGHQQIRFALNSKNRYSAEKIFSSLRPGRYTLFVLDEKECEFQKDFEIVDEPFVETDLLAEIHLKLGDSTRLDLQIFPDRGIVRSIAWNPATHLSCSNCEDPIANPLENSLYEVTVTDTNGCTAVQRIRILIDQPQVWVPNAFSPNGDQINDLVWIHGSQEEVTRIRTFQIFDRWGNRVFENKDFKPNDQSAGWDGRYQSQKCSPGVFVYWAEVELVNGESWIIKGDISLIR